MINRGINFKQYYALLLTVENDNQLCAREKREQRNKIFDFLIEDLEKNFIGGHIYRDELEQIQRRDYFCNLKIGYYPTCSSKMHTMRLIFMHDCVSLNGLYIKY